MKKIQKNTVRFDNLKQDFLDDKKYSGTAEATLNGYRYDITRFLKFLSDEQLAVNEPDSVLFRRYLWHLLSGDWTGYFHPVAVHCVLEVRGHCSGRTQRKASVFLLCMGLYDVYLRSCCGYPVLLFFGMGAVCNRPPSGRDGQHSGLGRGISLVPLELYPVGLLSGAGGSIRLYAARKKKNPPEILGSLPPDSGQAHRWLGRAYH